MLIKNGFVFDYESNINGESLDIEIKDGIISRIGKNLDYSGNDIIDAVSFFVVPGLVDMHCHLREPGFEHKETIKSGLASAAKGGITTVCAMPNTEPPTDNPEILKKVERLAQEAGFGEAFFVSAMTRGRKGEEPMDFQKNKEAGFIAFSDDGSGIQFNTLMIRLAGLAKSSGALLMEHPEMEVLSKNQPVSYGKLAEKLGIDGQPAEAESLALLKFGAFCGMNGAKIHFTHISTALSVNAIRFLKAAYPGLITADTTPHHLLLSEEDNLLLDTNKKMNPPLRPLKDRLAIEQGVIDGTIDCIATDHAPHTEKEKSTDFYKAPFGTIGFETFLPSTYTHLVRNNLISMLEWVKLVSYTPSKILGISRGTIKAGESANITIFDPNKYFEVGKDFFISKSKNSAFLGHKFYGVSEYTVFGGKIVYEKGQG